MRELPKPPAHNERTFNCPSCGAYSVQFWFGVLGIPEGGKGGTEIPGWSASQCLHCRQWAIWHDKQMMYPLRGMAPPAHRDLPDRIMSDYEEAALVIASSPRAAASLLRLALQNLLDHLEAKGRNPVEQIGDLVSRGLPTDLQRAFDAVGVTGDNVVNPGKLDMRADAETAIALFRLINIIAGRMIADPRKVEELYASLPAGARDHIDRGDGKQSASGAPAQTNSNGSATDRPGPRSAEGH